MNNRLRIFVDCTNTLTHYRTTGIQRVVRNIFRESVALKDDLGIEVLPISMSAGFYRVLPVEALLANFSDAEKHAGSSSSGFIDNVRKFLKNVLRLSLSLMFIRYVKKIVSYFFPSFPLLLRKLIVGMTSRGYLNDLPVFEPCAGDVVLMLDAAWGDDFLPSLKGFRERGSKIVFVIYDLIPIAYKEYCDPGFSRAFLKYINDAYSCADGLVAISKSVRDELRLFFLNDKGRVVDPPWIDYFHLGSDFFDKGSDDVGGLPEDIKEFIENSGSVYLVVGTIEPRKNHTYILTAFEKLWEKNLGVSLCIVGKPGWMMEDFLLKLKRHPQINRRLAVFHDVNDAMLQDIYRSVKALIFASKAEGFGLPIIEAMEASLPVIVSDIAVHHEVAGKNAHYVNPNVPEDLVKKIESIESGKESLVLDAAKFEWMSWKDSANMLLELLKERYAKNN